MKTDKLFASRILCGATVVLLTATLTAFAAEKQSSAEKQRKLIAILKSDAPPKDKAIPCKELAIYGDKEAVPALAPLLADTNLASWARIALQAIPGPEADEALRSAIPNLKGNLLIGTMNTIGIRRDAKAVNALVGRLADGNPGVVAAAAAALGSIGGSEAAAALNKALANASKENISGISEGALLCAERFLEREKFADAAQLYDAVRTANVSTQRKLEATRGAILARQSDGIPMLMELLRSPEKETLAMGLRTARELPGREATEALGTELQRANADRQVMLLLALADRQDSAVFPKLLDAAQKGFKGTRVASLNRLDRFGDTKAVPVLLESASDEDAEIARTAKATLTRMEGKKVDSALLDRLPKATGKERQVIIELAALRRIEGAAPAIVKSVLDADPGVRRAALSTLSTLGTEKHAGELVRLLGQTKESQDREAIEGALTGIASRTGTKAVPEILPLAKNKDPELRILALRVLGTAGGTDALAAVAAAVEDADETVQDEAVGTLATWPNNWPEDTAVEAPLLKLAKSGRKTSYQVQGTRGYLLHLQESKKLSNEDKVNGIAGLLPHLKQTQQKRLAIATLSGIPTAKSLDTLLTLTTDPAVAEEACLAVVNLATGKNQAGMSKDTNRKALQAVIEKTKNDSTRSKAGEALKTI